MSFIINLQERYIGIEDLKVKLSFSNDDSFFYLRIIALVAQKMKDRVNTQDFSEYISINDIEDEAELIAKEKPGNFNSKESMKTNIYQAWRNRLKPMNLKCPYEIQWMQNEVEKNHIRAKIETYFEAEARKGPMRAAYKIGIAPSEIKIIPDSTLSNLINESKNKTSIIPIGDTERAQEYLRKIGEITDPIFYMNFILESNKAIASLLSQYEICKPNENGKLPLNVGEYAEIYLKHLGTTGSAISGFAMVDMWFKDLADDPWWTELIYTFEKRAFGDLYDKPYHKPDPEEMAKKCLQIGDIISLMWLFHWGHLAHIIAAKREHFISELQRQNTDVKEHVFRELAKNLNTKDDYLEVGRKIERYIKYMQSLYWSRMSSEQYLIPKKETEMN